MEVTNYRTMTPLKVVGPYAASSIIEIISLWYSYLYSTAIKLNYIYDLIPRGLFLYAYKKAALTCQVWFTCELQNNPFL